MSNFSNPRLSALPCELMRGCSFAEDWVTEIRAEDNGGLHSGSNFSIDHGVTFTGTTTYWLFTKCEQPGSFSVMIRFKASAVSTAGLLLDTANDLKDDILDDGFLVWVDADGVKANHSNGVSLPTKCEVDLDYADGVVHTITYIVDMSGGQHHLYVDALAVNTQTTTINERIGETSVGVSVGYTFAGTIYKQRIFNNALSESEHDLYHTGDITTFAKGQNPLAVYRCDEICDDTDGHKIWDRTLDMNDLYKADRSTSAAFPVLTGGNKYLFDLIDDYVTNWPTLPTNYTVIAALSTPREGFPYIRQENDTTLIDELTAPAGFWGYIHNLAIHNGTLNQLQLHHTEYMHMYMLDRGRAKGLYHRLITEGACIFAEFLDAGNFVYFDYSQEAPGIAYLVTRNGANGCTFGSATSHVFFEHAANYQCPDEISIVLQGTFTFSGLSPAQTFIDKGGNYKFRQSASNLDFNGSTCAIPNGTYNQIAVVCKDGHKPRFFADKAYVDVGTTTETLTSDTTDLVIGNNNELNERCQSTIKQVCICSKTLSDAEIRALGDLAEYIGGLPMETGQRVAPPVETFAGTVDYDKDPGADFQLIDVVMTWDVAPTTSENITIFSIRESVKITEESYDPSLSSDLQHMFRFDKRFDSGVTYGVDYPNTDTNSVKVYSTYQLDPSVT